MAPKYRTSIRRKIRPRSRSVRTNRRYSRRYTIKASRYRRTARRRTRKPKSFVARVLNATSRTEQLSSDNATINTSFPGKAQVIVDDPNVSNAIHQVIQGRLPSDEVLDSAAKKDYFLKSFKNVKSYMNGSQYQVQATLYYYTVRNDINISVSSYFANGFANDGTLLADDPLVTPYQSSDFCSVCKITRVVKRNLEQGQSIKAYINMGNMMMKADRRNNILSPKGSKGVIAIFVGSLGKITPTSVTTAPTDILFRNTINLSYQVLSDSQLNNWRNSSLATGTGANFTGANMDTGVATTGITASI